MFKQYILLTVLLSFSVLSFAQINQVDENGKKNGPWKVNFEGTSNPKFEGTFNHGKEIGEFKFYKKGFYDHPTAIMQFPEEEDSVSVTYYTQKGKPISKGKMLDRKREGKWEYYHQQSDSIMMTEVYKNDTLNGMQKTYFTNGNLAEETNYVNGEKDGSSKIYSENGKVTKKLNYKNGELHGSAIYYTPTGELLIEGNYSEGRKTGKWKYYEDGILDREEEY